MTLRLIECVLQEQDGGHCPAREAVWKGVPDSAGTSPLTAGQVGMALV